MSKIKETKTNGSSNGNLTNDKKNKGKTPQIFDVNNNEAFKSLIKAVTMTRKRLYPEMFDKRGRLKKEWTR